MATMKIDIRFILSFEPHCSALDLVMGTPATYCHTSRAECKLVYLRQVSIQDTTVYTKLWILSVGSEGDLSAWKFHKFCYVWIVYKKKFCRLIKKKKKGLFVFVTPPLYLLQKFLWCEISSCIACEPSVRKAGTDLIFDKMSSQILQNLHDTRFAFDSFPIDLKLSTFQQPCCQPDFKGLQIINSLWPC